MGVRLGVSPASQVHIYTEDLGQAFEKGLDLLLGFLLNQVGVRHRHSSEPQAVG